MLCEVLTREYQQFDIGLDKPDPLTTLRETTNGQSFFIFTTLKQALLALEKAPSASTTAAASATADNETLVGHYVMQFRDREKRLLRDYDLDKGKDILKKAQPTQPVGAAGKSDSDTEPLPETVPLAEAVGMLCEEINRLRLGELYQKVGDKQLAALCLSGGGIRSATFALGVIQGLARSNLLEKFHYLSTVSGGGYIGSWLTGWIHRHQKGEDGVIGELKSVPKPNVLFPEPDELHHLRKYSNYLAPRYGLLSADTWTLIAIYVRNLFLNWLILIPLLAAVLLAPRLTAAIVHRLNNGSPPWAEGWFWVLLLFSLILGIVALVFIGMNRPSMSNRRNRQTWFLWFCLLPLYVSAMVQAGLWAWYVGSGGSVSKLREDTFQMPLLNWLPPWFQDRKWAPFVIFGVALNLLSYVIWLFPLLCKALKKRLSPPPQQQKPKGKPKLYSLYEVGVLMVIGIACGYLLYLGASSSLFFTAEGKMTTAQSLLYVCFSLPLLLGIFLVTAFLFVGSVSFWTEDEDREWWSRSDAWILIVILGWAVISATVIFGPLLFGKVLSAIGGVSGLVSLILGYSTATSANKKMAGQQDWAALLKDKALMLAAPIFVLFIIVMLSLGASLVINRFAPSFEALPPTTQARVETAADEEQRQILQELAPWTIIATQTTAKQPFLPDPLRHLNAVYEPSPWFLVAALVVCVAISLGMACIVNINKFSIHSLYRNRLIRAYLGASHRNRKPNPFTGFDPNDNIPLSQLFAKDEQQGKEKGRKRLFHVVNMALNLVGGDDLAWQERKAESFIATPFHCGSRKVGYVPSQDYGNPEKGIDLGTAVAISGAAVSPNMGYHSSPVVTFVLTLFNLRLGWWLANPSVAKAKTLKLAGPWFALKPLGAETFGQTNSKSKYLYLSDGGHFENLGLYEMVRRRCGIIVVSDGGSDAEYHFEDLGNAIRKIRIDFGIRITFSGKLTIFPRSDDDKKNQDGVYVAIGDIHYEEVDDGAKPGKLIYLKPAFYGREPIDIYNYAKTSLTFPHESTGDQFFSESQFESYRALGEYVIRQAEKDLHRVF